MSKAVWLCQIDEVWDFHFSFSSFTSCRPNYHNIQSCLVSINFSFFCLLLVLVTRGALHTMRYCSCLQNCYATTSLSLEPYTFRLLIVLMFFFWTVLFYYFIDWKCFWWFFCDMFVYSYLFARSQDATHFSSIQYGLWYFEVICI